MVHDDEKDVKRIIDMVLQGHVNQFEDLIKIYEQKVFMIVSRFARSDSEREEYAQDVFIKVFQINYQCFFIINNCLLIFS